MDTLSNQPVADHNPAHKHYMRAGFDSMVEVHSLPFHQEVRTFQVEACRPELGKEHLDLSIVDTIEVAVGIVEVDVVVALEVGKALLSWVEVVFPVQIYLELENRNRGELILQLKKLCKKINLENFKIIIIKLMLYKQKKTQ